MSKKIRISLALLMLSPWILYVLVRYYLFRSALERDNALLDASDVMRGWRGLSGMLARRLVLGVILGPAFGKHVTVHNTLFSKGAVSVGENTYIGFNCNIGHVEIGREVLISDGATIMSGVGAGVVTGARSVVIKPVPDYQVAVGVPARPIKKNGQ